MSEEEAHDAFVKLRFVETDGEAFCIHCGCNALYRFTRKGRTPKSPVRRMFCCKACDRQFSVTSGTIFENHKLELRDLLIAIAFFINGAKGLSGLNLGRLLNVSYKTAFSLEGKLRQVMTALQQAQILEGKVEVDGMYVGGHVRPKNIKTKRVDRRRFENRTGKRKCIFVARERKGRSMAFVCSERDGAGKLPSILRPGSIVYADDAKAYDGLESIFDVRRVDHSKNYVDGDNSTNQAESANGRIRRAEMGTHHHISGCNSDLYANENLWREDRRRMSNGEQFMVIVSAALHHPVSGRWKGYWQRRKGA